MILLIFFISCVLPVSQVYTMQEPPQKSPASLEQLTLNYVYEHPLLALENAGFRTILAIAEHPVRGKLIDLIMYKAKHDAFVEPLSVWLGQMGLDSDEVFKITGTAIFYNEDMSVGNKRFLIDRLIKGDHLTNKQKRQLVIIKQIYLANYLSDADYRIDIDLYVLPMLDQLVYWTLLHVAADQGEEHLAQLLLELGANVSVRDILDNEMPLHRAAKKGYKKIVELLIQHGAQVDGKSSDGRTALHYAAQAERTDVIQVLLGHKADINAQTIRKETPLYQAVASGNSAAVACLLEKGAQVNIADRDGTMPLHQAVHGPVEILRMLLEKGADVHAIDTERKRTPLHEAVRNCKISAVRVLLEHRAAEDIDRADHVGVTPRSLAQKWGNKELYVLLNGAKTKSQTS